MKLDSILASKIFSFAFLCPFKVSRARNFERTAEIKDFKLEIKSVEIENVFGQSVYHLRMEYLFQLIMEIRGLQLIMDCQKKILLYLTNLQQQQLI
jgi:hypothetical protein